MLITIQHGRECAKVTFTAQVVALPTSADFGMSVGALGSPLRGVVPSAPLLLLLPQAVRCSLLVLLIGSPPVSTPSEPIARPGPSLPLYP